MTNPAVFHLALLPPVHLFCCLSLSVLIFLSSVKYEGPWLSTQIMISSSIGMASFLIFSYSRPRWPLLFAPRTQLKGTVLVFLRNIVYEEPPAGFSPHEAHAHGAFFGWILPTLRTSEYSVLQIVGLDAAVVSRVQTGSRDTLPLISLLAFKFFQDVILSVLVMLSIRGGHSDACESQGMRFSILESTSYLDQRKISVLGMKMTMTQTGARSNLKTNLHIRDLTGLTSYQMPIPISLCTFCSRICSPFFPCASSF